jgi:serine/threonine protein kinase
MSEPQNREEALFEAVRQFASAAERAAYLEGACAGDAALRQRLDSLLAAHDQTANALDHPPVAGPKTMLISTAMLPITERPGQTIGRYKLREKIGEGGCGVVYVADQEEPVRRRVALKIVKLGMDTRQVVARFEAERQVLALMDHPNIAKVLDGGATDTGRPFFVMELVRGIKITDYCDQNNLSTNERLKLFIQVCKAVQHAHQKGIIHRDIKPSNVLVTLHDGVPVPKVIDFGIAKATGEQRLTDKTIYTAFEQFIGTPAYMSPEQAEMSGLDIDTRSDIYSLGVLLYELLTGHPPFDPETLMSAGLDGMRRIIREEEPMRPSTRVTQELVAASRLVAPKLRAGGQSAADSKKDNSGALHPQSRVRYDHTEELVRFLKGDLDWIVMKLLEKDRTRRYDTANGVAADIQRHLDNEPVSARPPSRLYQFQKLVRRNKLAVAATLLVFLVLLLGVAGTTIGFLRSEKQRQRLKIAEQQEKSDFEQARAAVGDLLAISREDLRDLPGMQPLRVKLMQKVIDRYQPFLKQTTDDPEARAELARLYVDLAFTAREIGADRKNVVLPACEAAYAIQQDLVRQNPENRQWRLDLGWTIIDCKWWGTNASESQWVPTNALAIFEMLVNEDPADPFARTGLIWALNMQGSAKSGVRDLDGRRSRVLAEQLVKEYPHSASFRRDLANQLSWFACDSEGRSLTNRDGSLDLGAYVTNLFRANAIRAGVIADLQQQNPEIWLPAAPRDGEDQLLRPSVLWMKRDLAVSWSWAAENEEALKQWPQALALADRSAALYRELVEANPSMVQFARELKVALTDGVRIAQSSGDLAGARTRQAAADDFWQKHAEAKANVEVARREQL